MNFLIKTIFASLMIFAFVAIVACDNIIAGDDTKESNDKEINWMAYDEGLKAAKESEKQIVIDFTAKWCGWCKKMDKEAFSDPTIIKYMNENFISIRVDGDSRKELDVDGYKITERDLARKEFGVTGYPAFWFLEPDGTKIGPVKGYKPTDQWMSALTFVKDKKYETPKDSKTESSKGSN